MNEIVCHTKSGASATIRSPSEQVMAALLQPKPKTVLLTGAEAVYRFSLRCVARIATLRRVVYLDGANVFDPYELARYAHQHGLSEETLLKSVFVRRAFTCYQMYEMVARLPIDRLMASQAVLVVAGPCDTFFDESITSNRAARLFYRMLYRLEDASRADLPMLIVQPNKCSLTARGYFLTDLRRLGRIEVEIDETRSQKQEQRSRGAEEKRGRGARVHGRILPCSSAPVLPCLLPSSVRTRHLASGFLFLASCFLPLAS